jgi:hypothetical protein
MTSLVLDIDAINQIYHEQLFNYPGDFGKGRSNKIFMPFKHISEWREYLLSLQIRSVRVPTIHVEAYHAALKMMLLAWIEPAVIKSAEFQALRSLESALTGVYYQRVFEKEKHKHSKARKRCLGCKKCEKCATFKQGEFRPGLDKLLDYMASHDDLDNNLHSEEKKSNQSALSIIRNRLAHGEIFNNIPWGGLFESVREVIEHAYRNSGIDTSVVYPTSLQPLTEEHLYMPVNYSWN